MHKCTSEREFVVLSGQHQGQGGPPCLWPCWRSGCLLCTLCEMGFNSAETRPHDSIINERPNRQARFFYIVVFQSDTYTLRTAPPTHTNTYAHMYAHTHACMHACTHAHTRHILKTYSKSSLVKIQNWVEWGQRETHI